MQCVTQITTGVRWVNPAQPQGQLGMGAGMDGLSHQMLLHCLAPMLHIGQTACQQQGCQSVGQRAVLHHDAEENPHPERLLLIMCHRRKSRNASPCDIMPHVSD